jgi:hypothetical protein
VEALKVTMKPTIYIFRNFGSNRVNTAKSPIKDYSLFNKQEKPRKRAFCNELIELESNNTNNL